MPTDPVPSGGGGGPLEERLASDAKLLRKSLDRHFRRMVADDVLMARYELARLRAEVARLAAEVAIWRDIGGPTRTKTVQAALARRAALTTEGGDRA